MMVIEFSAQMTSSAYRREHGADARQADEPDLVPEIGAVDARGLIEIVGDRLQACQHHDGDQGKSFHTLMAMSSGMTRSGLASQLSALGMPPGPVIM